MEYTVAELAGLAHVPVSALRHFEQVGLLEPSRRSDAGYRVYGSEDVDRLAVLLTYRSLGLDEDEVRALLEEPTTVAAHLRRQQRLLEERRRQVDELLGVVATTLEYEESGPALSPEEKIRLVAGAAAGAAPASRKTELPTPV